MVTFTIVENPSTGLEDEFVRLYNSNMTLLEIQETLGINRSKSYRLQKRLIDEGRISYRDNSKRHGGCKKTYIKQNPSNPRWYCWNRGVMQFVCYHHNHRYLACFKTSKEAERFIELMKLSDWDYSRVDEFKKEVKQSGV